MYSYACAENVHEKVIYIYYIFFLEVFIIYKRMVLLFKYQRFTNAVLCIVYIRLWNIKSGQQRILKNALFTFFFFFFLFSEWGLYAAISFPYKLLKVLSAEGSHLWYQLQRKIRIVKHGVKKLFFSLFYWSINDLKPFIFRAR